MPELPPGTVTFLFTDIEGSTRLLRELGAEYAGALAEHRRVVREAVARHGGVEVDTQGDAFFVAFARPQDALAAAEDAQRELALPVRMGLHTGAPELTDEGYVGIDVHRAARICAAANGSQILVSNATASLVDRELCDLGKHRLKDFDEPVSLHQLGADRFPPLRTISNTNLPRPASSLVGRELEIREVAALIRDGSRLVTLTGPGGSGKTRLAIEAAYELVPEFESGVFWVGLAALRDPGLVTDAAARVLGAKEGLVEHVGERELLLLLDNFEQVVDAAPELSALIEACPNLRMLVTSRELLRVKGEVEYPVLPLGEQEAVELFCARAQSDPDEAIAELCRRLDDLPLAVELAAARASVLSPAQILERLSGRLDLLKGGRDAEARQQTLRSTIEWSYELLTAAERELFARLAVFAGGCPLVAAEQVAGADVDALQSLVEKSLVRHTRERFWMLETIREYALERFAGLEEADAIRLRHLSYLIESVEGLGSDIHGLTPGELVMVEAELDNIREALRWSLSEGDPAGGFRLAVAVGRYWVIRAHVEGYRWLSEALERAQAAAPALRARALLDAGACLFFAQDYAGAVGLSEEALSIFRRLGDTRAAADALDRLSAQQSGAGLEQEARVSANESLALFGQLGERLRTMYPLPKVAAFERQDGNREEAAAMLEQAISLAREAGDLWWLAAHLQQLAEWSLEDGDVSSAVPLLRESVDLARELENPVTLLWGLALLAWVAAEEGDHGQAGRLWGGLEAVERDGDSQLPPAARASLAERVEKAAGTEFSAGLEAVRRLAAEEAVELALSDYRAEEAPAPGSRSG